MSPEAGVTSTPALSLDPSGLLQTLQGHVEELRNFLQCGVCVRPMYEPFTLPCGHTFCYACLSQWFVSQQHRLSCPKCRASVKVEPGPAYLVREIVHYFMANAELLAVDETTAEHREEQLAQAQLLETDKQNDDPQNGGLFGGCFRRNDSLLDPIRDAADGVERCPRCTWELEEGDCLHCGYSHEDNDFAFDSDDDSLGSTDDVDGFGSDGRSVDMSVDSQLEAGGLDLMYGLSEAGLYGHSDDEDDSDMDGFIDDGDIDEADEVDEADDSLIMDGGSQPQGNPRTDSDVISITSQPDGDEDDSHQIDVNNNGNDPIHVSDDHEEQDDNDVDSDSDSDSDSDPDSDPDSDSDVITSGDRRRSSPDRGRIQKYTPRHPSISDHDDFFDDFVDEDQDSDFGTSHHPHTKDPISDGERAPSSTKPTRHYWHDAEEDDEEDGEEEEEGDEDDELTSDDDQAHVSSIPKSRLRAPI